MIASPVAIVVDADLTELRRTEQALEKVGFVVMGAGSFAQAKSLLVSITPEIVIADVKLEAFNGLHLAALCAVWRPATPFVATHNTHDPVLEADASRLNASYVVKTHGREDLVRTAVELLRSHRYGHEAIRQTHRKLAPTSTVVRIDASAAEVIDLSYGGVRLKLQSVSGPQAERVPESFDIVFPDEAFSLRAERIWAAHDSQTGGWLCGVDVSQSDSLQLQRWREYVDSVV
jgi:DNA-binding NarL/FixJ family response regulator